MSAIKVSQSDHILSILKLGRSITPAEAYTLCGTLALHSRIAELRERGHDIRCELVRTAGGKTVGSYTLRGQLELAA